MLPGQLRRISSPRYMLCGYEEHKSVLLNVKRPRNELDYDHYLKFLLFSPPNSNPHVTLQMCPATLSIPRILRIHNLKLIPP